VVSQKNTNDNLHGNNHLDCYLTTPSQGAFYCREAGRLVTFGDKFFDPSLKHPSLQKYPSLAFEAFKADVGTHPHHFPFVAAAGVRFAQPDHIANFLAFCDSFTL
jgi:hypothetical protein